MYATQFNRKESILGIGRMDMCPIDDNMIPRNLPHTEEWSAEMYYRLALGEILPESEDRILYLDVDIIVNQNLKNFYYRSYLK